MNFSDIISKKMNKATTLNALLMNKEVASLGLTEADALKVVSEFIGSVTTAADMFEEDVKEIAVLEKKTDKAKLAFRNVQEKLLKEKGLTVPSNGLLPDAVRFDPEYKKAKANYDKAANAVKSCIMRIIKTYGRKRFNDWSRRQVDARRQQRLAASKGEQAATYSQFRGGPIILGVGISKDVLEKLLAAGFKYGRNNAKALIPDSVPNGQLAKSYNTLPEVRSALYMYLSDKSADGNPRVIIRWFTDPDSMDDHKKKSLRIKQLKEFIVYAANHLYKGHEQAAVLETAVKRISFTKSGNKATLVAKKMNPGETMYLYKVLGPKFHIAEHPATLKADKDAGTLTAVVTLPGKNPPSENAMKTSFRKAIESILAYLRNKGKK